MANVSEESSNNKIDIVTNVENNVTVTQPNIQTVTIKAQGPAGPQGPAGEQGPQGPAGSGAAEVDSLNEFSGSAKISIDALNTFTGSAVFTNITASGDISSSGTVKAFTGSFGRLEGLSPITVGDSVIFEQPVTGSIFSGSFVGTITSALPTGLLSSSAQIATEISGAFSAPSASFSTRVTSLESGGVSIPTGTVSSSLQITQLGFVTSSATASFAITGSNVTFADITASGGIQGDSLTTKQYIYHKGDLNTFINFTDNRIRFNAGGINFLSLEEDGSAPYPVTVNNGGNRINFRVVDRNSSLLLKTDSEAFKVNLYHAGNQKLETQIGGIGVTGDISASGHITASGNISSSGTIVASNLSGTNTGDQNLSPYLLSANTASFVINSQTGSFLTSLPSGLLSGSAQISTEISGAFNTPSASFSTRVTSLENNPTVSSGTVSSSLQITQLGFVTSSATASFVTNSQTASFVTNSQTGSFITSLPTGVLSGSAQIASNISGSFTATSSSLASRTSTLEGAGYITSAFPFTGDAQITGSLTISGSFNAFTLDSDNIVLGSGSGLVMQAGADSNVVIGTNVGTSLTTGNANVLIGSNVGGTLDTEANNIMIGYGVGSNSNGGDQNVYIGSEAGRYGSNAEYNVAVGYHALRGGINNTGIFNTAIGYRAGSTIDNGSYNSFMGYDAGRNVDTGNKNILLGYNSGYDIEGGEFNITIGENSGRSIVDGSDNISIGNAITFPSDVSKQLIIGSGSVATISASLETGDIIFASTASAAYFVGDGSQLTGIDTGSTSLPIKNFANATQFTVTDTTGLLFESVGNITIGFNSGTKKITYTVPSILLSGSAQIASDISGSFTAPSASFSTRVTTNATSISTNTSNVSSNLTKINSLAAATASLVAETLSIFRQEGSPPPGNGTTHSIAVTVADVNGENKYVLAGVVTGSVVMNQGDAYKFDQSDGTNDGHPFRFSTDEAGSSNYDTGVTTAGVPGNSGAYTLISVTGTTTAPLYYYCASHSGMGTGILSVDSGSLQSTGFAKITGSLIVSSSNVDFLQSTGVSGSFSGSFEGNGSQLTFNNGITLDGSNYDANGTAKYRVDGYSVIQNTSTTLKIAGNNYWETITYGNEDTDKHSFTGQITASGTISGSAFIGDGSGLTNLPGGGTSTFIASGSTSASAAPNTGVVIEHSGSTAFSVIGDVGTLFSVDDDLTGTLFSVNDISGIPQLEVSASGKVEVGKGPLIANTFETGSIANASPSSPLQMTIPSGSSKQLYGVGGYFRASWDDGDSDHIWFQDDNIRLSYDLSGVDIEGTITKDPASGEIHISLDKDGTRSALDKQVSDGIFDLNATIGTDQTDRYIFAAPTDPTWPYYKIEVTRTSATHGSGFYAIVEKFI